MTTLKHNRPLQLFHLPMLRNLAEPFDAGGFEFRIRVEPAGAGGFGRETARDRSRDESAALFLQLLDQFPLLRQQRVQLRRLGIEKVSNGDLLTNWWE